MRIIHVSGSPGSGKTTLGKRIQDVKAIDTDDLISDEEGLALRAREETHSKAAAIRAWKKHFITEIRREITQAETEGVETLVFTGILNHWSPDGTVLEMPEANMTKYFIVLPPIEQVKRFYQRYCQDLRSDDEFWSGVAERRYIIPSSVDYLDANTKEAEWHRVHGYLLLPMHEIERRITMKPTALKAILCKMCGNPGEVTCLTCNRPELYSYCSKSCYESDIDDHALIHAQMFSK